jgi:hypothetical protein
MNPKRKSILIASLVLILSSSNFSRFHDLECLRPVHMLTLMTMGGAVVVIVQQLIQFYKNKQD